MLQLSLIKVHIHIRKWIFLLLLFFEPLVQFNTMPNDFSELVSVIASFLFLIISLFIHVYLLRYIRLFSFLLSYGKTRATKNIQLVTQQRKRESENHL